MSGRLCALLVVAAAALPLLAAPASAATVEISPSTATSLTSLGTPVITTPAGGIRCLFELEFSMLSSANGTLTATPDPTVNPWVGRSNSGSATSCGTTTTLLFAPQWRYHVYDVIAGGGANGYLENVGVLFDHSAMFRCLYRLRLLTTQQVGLGLLEVTGATVLGSQSLTAFACPPITSFTGTFAFDVPHELEL